MKVLELFCGTKSFAKVCKERGHEVFTVDFDRRFNPDLCIDVMELKPDMIPFKPDIIWASPPCNKFSIASVYRHWKNGKPSHEGTWESLMLVAKTISLILVLRPKYWIIENPRGMLRKQKMMESFNRNTVTYCQYGFNYMKATDFWNNIDNWNSRPMCSPGSSCHEEARRTGNGGVQKVKGPTERGKVPKKLCLEIIKSCEKSFGC